jgi:ring-1,2-phenylacetyl-CoA epoxidase subunit PaaD
VVTRADVRGDARTPVVWAALDEVPDPEIPTISVVELGVIRGFRFERAADGRERLTVDLLPTFVGCPAIEMMREQVGERLRGLDLADEVTVELSFAEAWTSDRITPEGRAKLERSGFAPPPWVGAGQGNLLPTLDLLPMTREEVACPHCGSTRTTLENAFGPTLCRSIYHCDACHEAFEQFKAV